MQGFETQAVLGDKGYDSDTIIAQTEEMEAKAVIPPKSNRKNPREYDEYLYGERYKIECEFGYMKHYRRVFSRFNKMASRFFGFDQISTDPRINREGTVRDMQEKDRKNDEII